MSKGLGRGLGALLGDAALDSSKGSEVILLPLSQVEPGLNQPRKHFDQDALEELADSIRIHGILQPITVRRLSSGYYQIIAGERRWRASRMAGLSQIPVNVIEADDRKVMEIGLIENLQREDLNPMEEAAGYRSLMEEFSLTQEEAATRVGKSRSAVANTMRLLSLPMEIQWLLEQGTLTAGHGRALLSLPTAQQMSLSEKVVRMGLSVRETEAQVKLLLKEDNHAEIEASPAQKTKSSLQLYLQEAERDLSGRLGRKVKIAHGKRKGKIELEYYGQEDLESLLSALDLAGKGRFS
jgi:ParB family chromosome partitioning protein